MLTLEDLKGSMQITYNPTEWRRLCRYIDLDSPALCLLEGGAGGRVGHGPGDDGPRKQ